ncbi:MAG: hemerythrin domain-containing protein [Parvularculaceae bacterium]|nr:hemerythrin domain-containing protein [Parvularculaceae bacterium]
MVAPSIYDDHQSPSKRNRVRIEHDPWTIEPIPENLIDSPLDFIFAEHYRQREAASILMLLADGQFDVDGVRALIAFLEGDFALHIGDEELVLFPMLRQHCLPEDDVDRILARLVDEHREDEACLDVVTDILQKSVLSQSIQAIEGRKLRKFAEHIRQHLALENGVLLPIARVRLAETELGVLADMLKSRRF